MHLYLRQINTIKSKKLTSLKLLTISLESSMSLNMPSSLLVKFGPHSERKTQGNTLYTDALYTTPIQLHVGRPCFYTVHVQEMLGRGAWEQSRVLLVC